MFKIVDNEDQVKQNSDDVFRGDLSSWIYLILPYFSSS